MHKLSISILFVFALVACTEKPQVVATKGDAPAWQGAANAYAAGDWKAGDQKGWEAQMKSRADAQNEYVRIQGAN